MGELRDKLEGMIYEVSDLENAFYHYREYYLASEETMREYDTVSPGLNTPLSPARKKDHEAKLCAAIERRQRAEHFIKQREEELGRRATK
jgi:hypothetical protein